MLACLWCTVCKKITYNTTTRRGLSIPRTTSWLRAYASLAGGYGRSYYTAGSSARELCHLPSLRQQLPPFSHHAPPLPFRFTPHLDHQAIPTLMRFFPHLSACHSSLPFFSSFSSSFVFSLLSPPLAFPSSSSFSNSLFLSCFFSPQFIPLSTLVLLLNLPLLSSFSYFSFLLLPVLFLPFPRHQASCLSPGK